MTNTQPSNSYFVVSLFSGCGGGDLGFRGNFSFLDEYFEALPFDTVWANDIDAFAAKAYRHNLGKNTCEGDIRKVDFASVQLPNIDVLLAGFPCQEFAQLGPRGGLQSKRGQLYKEVRRALRALKPRIFLAENVPGIEKPASTLRTIVRGLAGRSEPRYEIQVFNVNAADYGVPQLRRRILIVGIRNDLPLTFQSPQITHSNPDGQSDGLRPWLTAKQALDDLWWPSVELPPVSVCDQEKITQAAIVLDRPKRRDKRLNADQPSPIIRAEHHGHVELHYNILEDGSSRHLSVRECARLQGFPDNFTFPVTLTQAYRQIGNAMPPVMLHHWARSVLLWLRTCSSAESVGQHLPQRHRRDTKVTSKIMAAVRSQGSQAERALGRAMWGAGLRYRKHSKGLPGKPDYVFPGLKLAVFCDGDFWHGYGWKERGFPSWDSQFVGLNNSDFWRAKILRNMARDKEVNQQLSSRGWVILRLRESDILKDADRCADFVKQALISSEVLVRYLDCAGYENGL